MRMQLLFADGEGRNWKVFGPRPAEGADERKVSCGPPLSGGCGPHSPADCNMLRHATERERGLASQTKDFSVEIPFIFLFGKRKMWNDADGSRFFGLLFADGGGRTRAESELQSAAVGVGELRGSSEPHFFNVCFICYLLFGQKVTPKTAAVKRFRGQPCDCAKSDAYGTFEAIKSPLTQTFSRLGKARTSSALPSAYRKRSPILYAPSPRPPFSRNRFCHGMG